MDIFLMLITFLTPIVTALTQIIKNDVPKKFRSITPVIIGIILGILMYPLLPILGAASIDIGVLIWVGFLSGLSASGVYNIKDIRKKD